MSKRKNSRNGSGESIDFVAFPTAPVETSTLHPREESCGGFVSSSDGTVEVQLTGMDSSVTVAVFAGAYNHYSVDILGGGGTVALTNIMLFWQ